MGSIYKDISNWADQLYEYSISMICNFGIIDYCNSSQHFSISNKEPEIFKKLIFNPVESHLHWLGVGVGIEMFIKSILLKFEALPITNRKITDKYPIKKEFSTSEERDKYFSDEIAMVYRSCNTKVIANSNQWIQKELMKEEIKYLIDIKTPTLGWLYKNGIKELLKVGAINEGEKCFLENSIQTFTEIRRNVDSHIFLGRVLGSIQKDREKVYLPMLNKLNEIYLK